jgi:hypothetical protein
MDDDDMMRMTMMTKMPMMMIMSVKTTMPKTLDNVRVGNSIGRPSAIQAEKKSNLEARPGPSVPEA